MNRISGALALAFNTAVAMLGYHINTHARGFWAVIDFVFSPLALVKWLVCHQINATVIHQTFGFLSS